MPSVHLTIVTGNDPAKRPKAYVSGGAIPPPSPLLYPVQTKSYLNQMQRTHVVRFHCDTLRKTPLINHLLFKQSIPSQINDYHYYNCARAPYH
jgi:hypothetical protein